MGCPERERGIGERAADAASRSPSLYPFSAVEERVKVRIAVDAARIEGFCQKHHIQRLAFFGSVLRDDFTPESDVDVLVEFEPGREPGLAFFQMEEELARILGRKVDLQTPGFLNPRYRNRVLHEAEVAYGAA